MTMMTETLVSGTTPVSDNVNLKQHLNTPSEEGQTLRGSVEKALHNYFAHLEGASVTDRAGRVYPLEANPNALLRLRKRARTTFEEVYRIVV